MSSNPSDAPYGLWSLVGITAFGALVAGEPLICINVTGIFYVN